MAGAIRAEKRVRAEMKKVKRQHKELRRRERRATKGKGFTRS
jgi:hypothetical protein